MELIRRKTDYALRCLVHLAQAARGQVISVHALAQREDIPEELLHKIMQDLSAAGIVLANRGRTGGFRLAKTPGKITVLGVLEALQGRFAMNRCFLAADRCRHKGDCGLRDKLIAIQEEMVAFFRAVTIADLLRQTDGPSP